MTRGEFADIRRRMRGMDGDIRGLAQSSNLASERANRLSQSIRGVSGRLGQLHRTGQLASHEMDYMRRSMGLLGRDLRMAARSGEISREEFSRLRDQLDETRLGFDQLDNELRRHNATAQRRAREMAQAHAEALRENARRDAEEAQRRREARRREVADGQHRFNLIQRLSRAHSDALRENARRDAAEARRQAREMARAHAEALRENARRDAEEAKRLRDERRRQEAEGRLRFNLQQRLDRAHSEALRENARREAQTRREELRQQMADGATRIAHQRRINRAHAAALREEEARARRAEAERRRLAAQAAARLRQAEAEFRQHLSRMARMTDDDHDLTGRFQGMGSGDVNRMGRALQTMSNALNSVSGSNMRARTTANALNRDVRVLSRALAEAARDGRLTRREFNALSRGMTQTANGARMLHRSGAMTRAAFRDTNREIQLLRAHLRLLGNEGNSFRRLDSRMIIFQNRLRDSHAHAGRLRRSFLGMGDGLTTGLRGGLRGVDMMVGGLRRMGGMLNVNRRWTAILIAALVLIGPIAQALGAVLTTALGGAFMALGAFALRGSKQVKTAFTEMKGSLDRTLKESAAPLQDELAQGMYDVVTAVNRMKPALHAAFSATGPLVKDFVGGITDLVEFALPGFVEALTRSGPVMRGFREAMGMIGQGLGDMFSVMTDRGGAEGLHQSWRTLGAELQNVLEELGRFINFASQSSTVTGLLVGVFRALVGVLNLVEGALSLVDALLGPLIDGLTSLAGGSGKFTARMRDMGNVSKTSASDLQALRQSLADVEERINKMKEARDSAMAKGPGGEEFLSSVGATDADLQEALGERRSLLRQISDAEANAAEQTRLHARSVGELVTQIQNLASVNRNYIDAQAAQEQAIADAAESQKKWGDALSWSNGHLVRNGQAGRDAWEQLSKIASTTQEATDKAVKANAPWQEISKTWKDGRKSLIEMADGWGLNKQQAEELADQILGIPPRKDVFVEATTQGAINSLDAVIAAMEAAPDDKVITVQTLTGEAERILTELGYTVVRMPDGTINISANTDTASAGIGQVQAARDKLSGKTIKIGAATGAAIGDIGAVAGRVAGLRGKQIVIDANTGPFHAATRGLIGGVLGTAYINVQRRYDNQVAKPFGASGGKASDLPTKRFAKGGDSVSGGVLDGPGTKTSDSLVARLSRGEFVMRAAAVDKYGPDFMQRINQGLLNFNELPGFAKGGNTSSKARAAAKRKADAAAARQAMKEALKELRADVTFSHFGKMAGYKNTEFVNAVAKSDTLGGVVSGLNRMRSQIKGATSGKTESRLLKMLDRGGQNLIFHQKRLVKVNASLEKAKEKLDDLTQSAKQLREGIKNGILQETNITKSAQGDDSQVTINTIMSQMTANAANAKQFSSMLDQLKKRGLSGDLIAQIAEAGISGGGMETAAAILGGGKAEISRLNALQKDINKFADAAGKTASDAMYGAGIRAAQGLVNGLMKQKKLIESHMLKLAKSMEKAIKKALGIKSPSRVMEMVGKYTAEGFALGIERNSHPQKAVETMLAVTDSGRRVAQPVTNTRDSGQPMVIQLQIGSHSLGEIVIDPLRKSIRHRGGNVQAVLGK